MSPTIPTTSASVGGSENAFGTTTSGGAQVYLYIFLGTLLFVLLVSFAVVARSMVARRRNRRMVDEAIANGTWTPPPGRFQVDLKMKPKMWDAHIVDPLDSPPAEWKGIMPFAASYIPTATSSDSTFATAFTSISAPRSVIDPSTQSLHAPRANTHSRIEQPQVHLAFLIAMPVRPSPSSSASASATSLAASLDSAPTPPTPVWVSSMEDDENLLPYLEVGTMAVGLVPAMPLSDGGGNEIGSEGEGSIAGESGSEEGSSVSQCGRGN
ncbi:hypothetical protein FB45DRAFT_921316 [Roridomyces roridus]|uniref:Uncharacterized protein n=1 Tax=Roridomyces roridus TaxID=1738132 RepID=A0AAD7BQC3_9AGAR|nr:hypothetical protein FB45DRAFT_921316 [Roridomyces roridus]